MGDWLVRQIKVLGAIPFQNWMLLALATIVAWVTLTWLTRSLGSDSFYFFFAVMWLVVMICWPLFVTFAE